MNPRDPLQKVKYSVRCVDAYTLAARTAPVKLNQNENPYELPESIKRGVIERMQARPWSRYPDFDPHELIEGLAAFAGWKPEGILAGNAPSDALFRQAGAAVGAASSPGGDVRGPVEYKRAMAAELTLRALRRATERALASA